MKRGPDRDLTIFLWWTVIVISAAMAVFLIVAPPPAKATTRSPALDAFASKFAMRPVAVRCYEAVEKDSPWGYGAWGYVMKPTGKARFTAIDSRICAGFLNVNDTSLPRWQRALGVGVLTHEAYHLRRWGGNQNEAKTECKAVRHWKTAARIAGATEETVEDLWPTALASHYRLAEYVSWIDGSRPYYDPNCEVPPLFDLPD